MQHTSPIAKRKFEAWPAEAPHRRPFYTALPTHLHHCPHMMRDRLTADSLNFFLAHNADNGSLCAKSAFGMMGIDARGCRVIPSCVPDASACRAGQTSKQRQRSIAEARSLDFPSVRVTRPRRGATSGSLAPWIRRQGRQRPCRFRFLVASARCGDLLLCAKHLFVAAIGGSSRDGCGMGDPVGLDSAARSPNASAARSGPDRQRKPLQPRESG
jgi:hypothetical protein